MGTDSQLILITNQFLPNTMNNTEKTRTRNPQIPLRRRRALLLVALSCLADSVSAEARWVHWNQWTCGNGHYRSSASSNCMKCGGERPEGRPDKPKWASGNRDYW